ncbi:MAG: rod shape-determining protein MreD, partial [Limnobacter sp.]|nr:rod shape-determining protein MreD [Limnobacter sp.]
MRTHHAGRSSILRPANPWFIGFSLIVATILEMIPIDRTVVTPDFLALVLLFWNIRQPRQVGIGLAWVFGVIMDVHSASVFGEHALAYTLLSYFAITIHRRVLWFSVPMQAVHILPLLVAAQWVTLGLRLALGGLNPGWLVLVEPFLTAAL